MKVEFRPVVSGLKDIGWGHDGWMVFFQNQFIALLHHAHDRVHLAYGEIVPWKVAPLSWATLDDARAEFELWAEIYAAGTTPDQVYGLIDTLERRRK